MKELTFVVQGKIHSNTKNCLSSIRLYYPESTIILSTWKDEPVSHLHYDVLLENEDPGAWEIDKDFYFNINRQIISTRNGLQAVKTPFAVKMRTDTQIVDRLIPELLKQTAAGQLFKSKILACNFFFRDPRKFPLLFHIGDIFQAGFTDDLIDLWDIELSQEKFVRIERNNFLIFNDFRTMNLRYVPEQYLFVTFLAKHKIHVSLDYCCEMSWEKALLSESLIAKNFKILTIDELGIHLPVRLIVEKLPLTVYQSSTLDNFSTNPAQKKLKRMIYKHRWRLIRKFLRSPSLWVDFFKKVIPKSN